MNARMLILALALSLVLWLVIIALLFAVVTHAATPKPRRLAPPVACTSHNRMDVFIDEDLIMWECECRVLVTIMQCTWQVVGGVDAVDSRRRHLAKPKRIIAFTIPAVVA